MLLDARVVHAQLRRAGGEASREPEVRQRRAVEILRRPGAEVLGIDLVVVERHEGARFVGRGAGEALPGKAQDGFEDGLLRLGCGSWHEVLVVFMADVPGGIPLVGARRGRPKRHFPPSCAAITMPG